MATARIIRFAPLALATILIAGSSSLYTTPAFGVPAAAPTVIDDPNPDPSSNTGIVNNFPAGNKDKIKAPYFLSAYGSGGNMGIRGTNFNVGDLVTLHVWYYSGDEVVHNTRVARPYPSQSRGTIYVTTYFAWPCASGSPTNGYARAFDHTTGMWSKKLHLQLCQHIDEDN
ncbi:hypothetical protein [Streptomyces sp. 1222.5]|uniref:hypothetical protein n=1 Tax=Streptomyces sp. 1222.5 TaxID=1881026 RepID=UPI003EBAFC34